MSERTEAEWHEWGANKGVTFAPLWNRVGMTREQNRQADALLAENQRLRDEHDALLDDGLAEEMA